MIGVQMLLLLHSYINVLKVGEKTNYKLSQNKLLILKNCMEIEFQNIELHVGMPRNH